MRGLAGIAFLLVFFQDKDTLKKAVDGMDDWKSYHYRISVRNLTTKKDDTRAGEYLFPRTVTLRKGITEIAKKGDKSMVNSGRGYVALDQVKDPRTRDLAVGLEPPHQSLMALVDGMEKVQKEKKDSDLDGVKCRVYHSPLTKDAVPKYAKRFISAASERMINWAESSGGVRIYVGKEDGWVRKILFSFTFQTTGVRGTQATQYEEEIQYFDIEKAKLNLPDEVKKELEIVDD